tara:strand:- start:23282 stop:23446 length:165 start_codon:yes stop_codon:yes gene_type:complete
MGKIKSALISWNEDNGYEPSQTSGWKKKPKMKDLVKLHQKNSKLINKILWKRRR